MKLEYDRISPITGNECVIEEANQRDNSVSFLCMESGYSSHEHLIEGSEFQKKYERHLTELMMILKFIDDDKRAWYPTFMQMPGGMLYCEGTEELWNWKVAKIVAIIGEERKKYPIVGKEGEYHTSRLDVENANMYDKENFAAALDELYTIVKEFYNENKLRDNSMQ